MKTRLVALAILCLVLCLPMFGQTFGDVSGEVRDASGAVVGAATITIRNVNTGAVRTIQSNAAGVYSFPSLNPGTYVLRAEKPGFKVLTRSNIEVQVQQSMRQDLELQVGQVTESVEVSASAVSLVTENATLGTVIDNKRIVEMPLNGRNYLQLVSLAPNVSFGFPSAGQAGSRQGGIRTDQSISVGGQRAQFNRFSLDGVENTDPNFNSFIALPSIDAIQEFKVQSGVYPAEFGRAASQINVMTKGGGNDYHASLFSFVRNDKFDAKNYAFTSNRPPTDPFKWNQYGFTLSGPVMIPKLLNGKNKLFFMTNYEWFRQRRNVQGVYNLPTDAMFSGNFSNVNNVNGIFDPRTRATVNGQVVAQPFPGNSIPTSRVHPTSTKMLAFYPRSNVAGATGTIQNRVQGLGRPVDRDQLTVRGDFNESSKSTWFGRYSWGDENQLTEALQLNGDKIITTFDQYMVSNTRVLSPTLVNETRFGFSRFYNTTGPELAFTRNVVGDLAIPGLNPGPPVQWGIPNVSLSNYSGFGNGSEGPYENNNRVLQISNNTSLIRGRHTFRFGGELRKDQYNQVGNQFARGQFTFTRNATQQLGVSNSGDSFADFLLGEVFQAEAAVSIANAQFRQTGFALYFDDSWKINTKLTLNIGLRYEYTPPWEDQTGTLFNGIVRQDIRPTDFRNAIVADRSVYPFFMRQGEASNEPYRGINLRWPDIEVRQDGSLGNRLVGADRNDFGPRFGLSYSPNQKWVFRLGGGMFYNQDTGNPRFDMARNLAGRLRDNSNAQFPHLNWNNSLASIAGGVANVPRPYTFANPYDRRTPYTAQYLFNVQRELMGNLLFEVGYLGSVSHRLESLRAVNEAIPADPRVTNLSVANRSPFPNFGRIQLVDNGGSANYHSLGAKLTKRYSNGLTFLSAYTWSKSIDNATAIRNQGGDTLFPQNSYCRSCERAVSSFNTAHRFTTSASYDIPVGKGKKVDLQNGFADAILGGWQLGSILTLQTGFPITVTNSEDTSNTGAFFDRPNSTGQTVALARGQQDPQRFFNTDAFVKQAPGTHGDVGRNTLTGPGIIGWDFSTFKNFTMPFNENHKLQFRFEAFNFPNHPNWGNPDTNRNSQSFGRLTGTRTNMRNLQLGLKYNF